jgi:hypothetical protein
MDHALLLRFLQVVTEEGCAVSGAISTTDSERTWRFAPAQTWTRQPHRIIVNSLLEDLAGNSIARPFEVDLEGTPPAKVPPTIALPFTPAIVESSTAVR